MLKKRIIASVIVKDGIVVQSIGFKRYLPVGSVSVALEFLDDWGVDEIILLDITSTKNNDLTILKNLHKNLRNCFVPLTYGGGLKSIDDVSIAFKNGADKVSFNHSFLYYPELIEKVIGAYGSQSAVISIDVKEKEGNCFVFDYLKEGCMDLTIEEALEKAYDLNVGEILINSVDHDGQYCGFNLELFKFFSKSKIPIILMGGARTAEHFLEGFENTNCDALAAGNMFHFQEHSVTKLKSVLNQPYIRKDSFFKYEDHAYHKDQRLLKLDEDLLHKLMYEQLKNQEI